MTLADLRRAAELLPAGATITLPVEHILTALPDGGSLRPNDATPTQGSTPDQWLTAEQVGELIQKSARWVYDHRKQLGGAKLTGRTTRFSRNAVERFLNRRRT